MKRSFKNLAIFAYLRRLHFISWSQGMAEFQQEVKESIKDLLIPDFLAMSIRTIVNFGKSLIGFLIMMGFLNLILIFLLLLLALLSYVLKGHISQLGIFLNIQAAKYFSLIISSSYAILLVAISVASFIYWWGNKYQFRKERQKIATVKA